MHLFSGLLLILALTVAALGSADAQPPPPPLHSLWIYKGGAIGEVTSIAVSMNIAPFKAYVIAFSHGVHSTIRKPQLLHPIHILASGPFTTINTAIHKVALPDEKSLVGLPIHLQGAVSDGSTWLFTDVCTWLIAPRIPRQFTLANARKDFPVQPWDGNARVTLADSTVLISGGRDPSIPSIYYRRSAYAYDPVRSVSTLVGTMNTGRGGHVMEPLSDGTYLVVGGDSITTNPLAEIYNPQTRKFQAIGAVPYFLKNPVSAVIKAPGTGREYVLLAGGSQDHSDSPTARAMLYDAKNRTFVKLPDMARQRQYAAGLAMAGGAVLITGGRDANLAVRDDAELFLLSTRKFYPWGKMTRPRCGHAMIGLDAYRALILSGADQNGNLRDMEFFDGLQLRSYPLPHRLHIGRFRFNPVVLADGSILVAGGRFSGPPIMSRIAEVLTATGSTLLRPIGELHPKVEVQALKGGSAMAYGLSTVHHLK